MTALDQYQKLEALGLWRGNADEQRREVVVSIGDATLMIYDKADRPIAHWSLPAVIRRNPGARPALFSPAEDAAEELELSDDEIIDAVEKVRKTIERRRPHRGRLRAVVMALVLFLVFALGDFWLPDALVKHAASVVPDVKRQDIGNRLLTNIQRGSGQPCETRAGRRALDRLKARLMPDADGRLVVVPGGISSTVHLPGEFIVLNRALVEDFEAPDVVAGYVIVEAVRMSAKDPLERLLEDAGPISALRLMTTGDLPDKVLARHSENLMTLPPLRPSNEAVLTVFRRAKVATSPYAYAVDITGEKTLSLIEADPGGGAEILPDSDWINLQGICGE